MQAKLKSAPVQIKSSDDASGIVEALVATYDVDSSGDKIMPGAFAKTLGEWADTGQPIPFIWSHLHDDIDAYLGDVLEARETDGGLYVKAQIDMDDPKSAKAYRLLKSGRVRNYSFAYDVRDSSPAEDDDGVTELRELGVFEVGPTLIGMNRETQTLSVKRRKAFGDDGGDGGGDGEDAPRAEADVRADIAATAQKLVELFDELGEDAPDAVVELATPPESSDDEKRTSTSTKIGRVVSAKNEQKLRDAHAAIGDVLAQLDSEKPSSDEDKSHTAEPVKRDEPVRVKRDEPMQSGPDDDLAMQIRLSFAKG